MKLKLTVDGKVYEVDVEVAEPEAPRPSYVPPMGSAAAAAAHAAGPSTTAQPTRGDQPVADESKVCRSTISGVVVRVTAQVGQAVQVNDELLVLEAMKMETVVTSPVAGQIAKINVGPGDPVQGGCVLVEFE